MSRARRESYWSDLESEAALDVLSDIRRPVGRGLCPACMQDVRDSLAAHVVPADRIAGRYARFVDEPVPVRGYFCGRCDSVLAIDPNDPDCSVGPQTGKDGWVPVTAVFADGAKRPVLVPGSEVPR